MGFIPKDACWYLADIVLEHRITGDSRNLVHINRHLIKAKSPQQAYEKAMALGRAARSKYRNTDGNLVRVLFRGLAELNVIHEDLEDGAELSYRELVAVPDDELRELIPSKRNLGVFAPIRTGIDGPNTMPESVMQMLEAKGFNRDEVLGSETKRSR